MDGKVIQFVNCKILRNHSIYEDIFLVCGGKIIDPEKVFFEEKRKPDIIIDLKGCIVSPGFIDVQINGGFGVDFTHDLFQNPEGLNIVAKGILAYGVTSFCPTLVTSTPQNYRRVLHLLSPRKGGLRGASILGAHVEGPFINKKKMGAHNAEYISELSNGPASVLDMYGDLENVKMLTLAPELENSYEVIRWLVEKEIIVCLGHSVADVEVGEEAINSGARVLTHLFNAMLPFHHRNPGLVGLLGTTCENPVYYGLIPDGIHTHPSSLRIAYRSLPKGAILVTDAISAMGFDEGIHHIGDKQIEIKGNQAFIANTSTLCGSVATMDKCVRFFKESTDCTLVEALEAATLHPAQALGIEATKGTLSFGRDADFILLNDELEVLSTWIGGICVWSQSPIFGNVGEFL